MDVEDLKSRIPNYEADLKRKQEEFRLFLKEKEFEFLEDTLIEEGFDDLEALCAIKEEDFLLVGVRSNLKGK